MTAGGPTLRVLAIGARCPDGLLEALQKDFKSVVHIVRSLHATCSCFISQCSIQVPGSDTTAQAVVKSYTKVRLDETEQQQVELEVRLHHQLTDKHAVPFWIAVEDSSQIHIISKFCSQGDLRQQINAGCLSEAAVRDQVILPLLHVLQHMHTQGIVHRDLKPENVFLADGGVLLGDFGLAVSVQQQRADASSGSCRTAPNSTMSSCCSDGTCTDMVCGSRGCSLSSYQSSNSSVGSAACSRTASPHGVHALKRGSVSSSNLPDLVADHASSCSSVISSPSRSTSGARMKRSSSAGCAGAWGCSPLPQLPIGTAGGTPAYSAPEVVLAAFSSGPAAPAVGPQNDIWALGVLALECLTGQHPFGNSDMSPYAFMFNIIGSKQLPIQHLSLSTACKDWLTQTLQKDPNRRATAKQLLQHQWIQNGLGPKQLQSVVDAVPQGLLPGPQVQEGFRLLQVQEATQHGHQSWHRESNVFEQQPQTADKRSGALSAQLAADLLKLSGLTEAEAATNSPYSSGSHAGRASSWCGWTDTHGVDAATVWGSSCPSGAGLEFEPAVVATISLSDMGCKDWSSGKQAAGVDKSTTPTLPCRLQQHSNCPSSVVVLSEPQQRQPVTLGFLDSIGSWED